MKLCEIGDAHRAILIAVRGKSKAAKKKEINATLALCGCDSCRAAINK